jgi:RecB family exonuclease
MILPEDQMAFSAAETINHIANEVKRIKKQNPITPVTIVSPNISLIHGINRSLLKSDQPYLNVRIETFYQFVKRHAEPVLLNAGLPLLTTEQALVLVQNILAESHLKYFHAARDFPSYGYFFLRTINELRTSVPQESRGKALLASGLKGKELFEIYQSYLAAKEGLGDYGDILENAPLPNETIILFPGVETDLNLMERNLLGKIPRVFRPENQPPVNNPTIDLRNPLSAVQEVKDLFREILALGTPFERAAVVCPQDYIPVVIDEANQLNVPVFCPQGEEILLDQIEIFKSALEVLDSDYDYHSLKRFFQLRNHFAPIRAMIECGVAVGGDLLKETAEELYQENSKDRFAKLTNTVEAFQEIETLKPQPHEMGKAIVDHFLIGSQETGILRAILQGLTEVIPEGNYETWKRLLLEKLSRIRTKATDRKNSIFLTTDFLPGIFDYVFLLGIKEGSFPGKFREDPILLDQEREAINVETTGTLRTAKDRNKDLRRSLEMTIACAEKGWFGSFPSMDLISGDQEFPSFYLVDVVREIVGKTTINQDIYQEKLRELRIPWSLENPGQCLDPLEWTLHHLINGTKGFINHIIKCHQAPLGHIKAHRGYWSPEFNEYTGFIGIKALGKSDKPRRFSATQLEGFMKCPYQWFIKRFLGVRALEEPETLERPDALAMGSIIHEVLETYMKQAKDPKHDTGTLDRIVNEVIEAKVATTGEIATIYLEKLRKDIGALTKSFLEHSNDHLQDGRKPVFFEFAFGIPHKESIQDQPVELRIGSHDILLTGSIDRIDIQGDRAFILDYKNSASKKYKAVEFSQGQQLQPALYAEAFMALKGKALKITEVQAGYLPLKGNSKEFLAPYDRNRKEKLGKIMDFILGDIKTGYFFPTGNCDWCDYQGICGKGIALAASGKIKNASNDPKVEKLAAAFNSFEEF